MARFIDHPCQPLWPTLGRCLLPLLMGGSLLILLLARDQQWRHHPAALVGLAIVVLFVAFLVLGRQYPQLWRQLVDSQALARQEQERATLHQALAGLGDEYLVLLHFPLEWLFVDCLILGPQGFFVVKKVSEAGRMHWEEGELFIGQRSLSRVTANQWRLVHLLHLLIRKGYQLEVLAHPLLVVEAAQLASPLDYQGVTLIQERQLARWIQQMQGTRIPAPFREGFGLYLQNRYFRC